MLINRANSEMYMGNTLLDGVDECIACLDRAIAVTEILGVQLTGSAEQLNDEINYRLKEIKSELNDLASKISDM